MLSQSHLAGAPAAVSQRWQGGIMNCAPYILLQQQRTQRDTIVAISCCPSAATAVAGTIKEQLIGLVVQRSLVVL